MFYAICFYCKHLWISNTFTCFMPYVFIVNIFGSQTRLHVLCHMFYCKHLWIPNTFTRFMPYVFIVNIFGSPTCLHVLCHMFYCKHLWDPKHVHCHLIYLRYYGSIWPEDDFVKSKQVASFPIDHKLMCFRLILMLRKKAVSPILSYLR
jgi:hypothetical protein